MTPAELLAKQWFVWPVTITAPGTRNALGQTTSPKSHEVKASVNASATQVLDTNGREVVASAVVHWATDGPLPQPGWLVTLPPEFGLKGGREVITARRVTSGTGLTPDHTEVVLR